MSQSLGRILVGLVFVLGWPAVGTTQTAPTAGPSNIGVPYYPLTQNTAGNTGLQRIDTGTTARRGTVLISIFRANRDRDSQNIDFSEHGVAVCFAVRDYVEVFASGVLQARLDFDGPAANGISPEYPLARPAIGQPDAWITGVGDTLIGVKLGVLDRLPTFVAARAAIKVPTASQERGLGTGTASVLVDTALSHLVAPKLLMHGSVGYRFNRDPEHLAIGDAFDWGVGATAPVHSHAFVTIEFAGVTRIGGRSLTYDNTYDLLISAGLHRGRFSIRPAIGVALHRVGIADSAIDRLGANLVVTMDLSR